MDINLELLSFIIHFCKLTAVLKSKLKWFPSITRYGNATKLCGKWLALMRMGLFPRKLLSASKTLQEKIFIQSTAIRWFCFFFLTKKIDESARTFLPKHGIYKLKSWTCIREGSAPSLLNLSSHTGFPKSRSAVPVWDSCSLQSLCVKSVIFVLNFCSHREHSWKMDPRSETLLSQCSHHSCG